MSRSTFDSPVSRSTPLPTSLSQMELQDDGVMLGLDSSLGKDIVGITNNVFQAPWGGSHTCQRDEKALECSLCQSSILCYQLGCELLERLTPREEIRLVVRHVLSYTLSHTHTHTQCIRTMCIMYVSLQD